MVDILHAILIDASPETVYDAITQEDGLKSWWTTDVKAEQKEGAVSVFGFYNHSVVFKMQIDELSKNKCVRWGCLGDDKEWKGTKLRFDLSQQDGKTNLLFAHTGWQSTKGYYAMCNTTWGHLMILLKQYSEGKETKPFFSD